MYFFVPRQTSKQPTIQTAGWQTLIHTPLCTNPYLTNPKIKSVILASQNVEGLRYKVTVRHTVLVGGGAG